MEKRRSAAGSTSHRKKADLATVLRKSWYRLRLSVRHPSRVPTWDAIVLTAASPEQAELYEWQLRRAKRMGRIAESTVTLAVPDPDGARIGSGAATLNALYRLAEHLREVSDPDGENSLPFVNGWLDTDLLPSFMVDSLIKKHILLLHAGGDSKRVPWANPMGKVFLPLPYLASDNPDGPVPLLFDHILAISSCARQAFSNEGGILIMTGDVLPCFDASTLTLPENSACIITVPITLDIASNHGVIVASRSDPESKFSLNVVENLLQKPSAKELVDGNAIGQDGRALLDTGVIALRGEAWVDLVKFASMSKFMIPELFKSGKEMSLYEELVAAWVPAKHDWLKLRPLGKELVNELGGHKMFSYCADDLLFLHFGTSSEVLDHLGENGSGLVGRRHLCSIPETTVCDIASSSIIIASKISSGVSIGEDSLIYDSSLSGRIQIGSQSIVVGVKIPQDDGKQLMGYSFQFLLPDRHCVWEVPLVGSKRRVLVYCGLHDNPKNTLTGSGTFCGKPWKMLFSTLGVEETDLWSLPETKDRCLWNANIFPVLTSFEMLSLSMWLMNVGNHDDGSMLSMWRSSDRISLEKLHRSIDFPQLCIASSNHQADLAAGFANACISYGLLGRNLSQLCEEILQKDEIGAKTCKDFLSLCQSLHVRSPQVLPQSRLYQVQVDLLRACRNEKTARITEQKVWAAVADETAYAVKYGFEDSLIHSFNSTDSAHQDNNFGENANTRHTPTRIRIDLPVRVDFVGGWSDTPPWSLERTGCVLNMAVNLEGSPPVGTTIEITGKGGILICDDDERQLYIEDPKSVAAPFGEEDTFRLVKSALLVTGVINDNHLMKMGLFIKTWANVPRGSGLGTSSILAAAVVKGLLRLMRKDEGNENIARIVLVLEQIMGTGGGWQDQIGGLYPGIKCTSSFPEKPLHLQVVPLFASTELIEQLQQRLLVVFTGQVRLAHQVLQKVVTRYLRRDNLLIRSIKRLAVLAKIGREAMMNGDLDELGDIMLEAWRLHQELDPYCSNEFVDRLFNFADHYCCGYKLVGAGGGGFALLLAKNQVCASQLKDLLERNPEFDVKVYNWSVSLE